MPVGSSAERTKLDVAVVTISLLLQLAAAYFALRLIRVTGKRFGWTLLAVAIFLMAVRRGLVLHEAVRGLAYVPSRTISAGEWIGLVISLLMVVGLAWAYPMFASLRRATDILRDNEEKYRTLFESSGAALLILRGDRVLDCNQSAAELMRTRRKDLIGKNLSELLPPRQPDGSGSETVARERVEAALAGRPQVFEWTLARGDGSLFPAEVRLNRFLLSGEPLVLASVWDLTEQKLIQKRIHDLSVAYETFVRASLVGIWRVEFPEPIPTGLPPEEIAARILDTGFFAEVNQTLAEMYGYQSPAEMVGKPVASLVHRREDSIQRLSTFVENGFRWAYVENSEVDSRGQIRYFANSYVGLPDGGFLTSIWGIQIDITERVKATQALRESEERYRALIENAGELIAVVQDEVVRFVNSKPLARYGYLPREVLGKPIWDFVHPQDRALLKGLYERRLRGEEVSGNFEFRLVARRGEVRWFRINAVPIEWEGRPAVLNFLADVTDRVLAEQALRESEELFRNLTETTSSAIVLYRGERFLYVNRAMEELTGYTRDELLAMKFWEVVHPDQRDEVRERGKARLRGEPVPDRYEIKLLRKDGQVRWVDFSARRILYHDEPAGLGTAIDITEKKLLQEQLFQSQKMEAIGRLAGGVAHDFNNILTAIRGYADLALQDVPPDSTLRKDLLEIRNAADRAADLTRQLLAFSRKQILRPQPLNLNDVLQEMRGMVARLIGEDIRLEMRLAPDLGPVELDPSQIQQVVMNLVVNARDAMPTGGVLTLETQNVELDDEYVRLHPEVKAGSYVLLTISDTGVGMDEPTKARIFEPFFTTKEAGKGTGLGLSTVYGIVKQSGGYIWVYSELGQGTTFKIYFPRLSRPGRPVERPPEPDVQRLTGSETILLVEDQPDVRQMAQRTLQRKGYRVLVAATPQEALQLLAQAGSTVDLVLTDVVMPGMNGAVLAEQIRAVLPEVCVLYTSGYTDSAIVERVAGDPRSDFLQKPFSPVVLLQKVRTLLDTAKRPREA